MSSFLAVAFTFVVIYVLIGMVWSYHFYYTAKPDLGLWIIWNWPLDFRMRTDDYLKPVYDQIHNKTKEVKTKLKEKFNGWR